MTVVLVKAKKNDLVGSTDDNKHSIRNKVATILGVSSFICFVLIFFLSRWLAIPGLICAAIAFKTRSKDKLILISTLLNYTSVMIITLQLLAGAAYTFEKPVFMKVIGDNIKSFIPSLIHDIDGYDGPTGK